MKYSKLLAFAFVLSLFISSCKEHQGARRPISQASGSFMKKSAERNKKLVANEESEIAALIKSNPTIKYIASSKGYWYSYEIQNQLDTLTPKKGDVAYFNYEIKDLKGNIIYSELELRPQTYHVDKQEIMMGLRDAIKLMRKSEKINFLFPSHMAFGYHGDNKKIGTNQPLLCTVTLNNFEPENAIKKEIKKPLAPATQQQTSTEDKTKDTLKQ